MSYRYTLCLLLLLSFSTFAEHKETENKNQVYSKSSASTVEKLNNATEDLRNPGKVLKRVVGFEDEQEQDNASEEASVEILRDPTEMSPNFRQALRGVRPTENSSNSAQDNAFPKMPEINLAAKILSKKNTPSVILKVNDQSLHVTEGKSASIVDNHQVIEIRVDEIKKTHVSIFVLPHNKQLILQ